MKHFKFFSILFIIFLFASFFFFQKEGELFFFKNKMSEEKEKSTSDEVKGVESQKEKGLALENIHFEIPSSRPVKKNGNTDLALPKAHASVVLDVDSGTILHYNNGKEKRQIASLTKIMTAIVVLENISDLDEEVAIDEESVYIDGTKVGCPRSGYCIGERLKVGEKISVRSLLKAMLMNSANDAATALAKYVSGSSDDFAKLMNKKAKEIGLSDTNFCTPSGLEIDGEEHQCYSTAYDIARIGAYSMKHKIIWDILQFPDTTIYSTDGKYTHDILNTDRLLEIMPNCLGGKTGFTPLAGYSLLMAAMDDTKKHKIVAVVLDDPYRWEDVQTMIDWAFYSYEWL